MVEHHPGRAQRHAEITHKHPYSNSCIKITACAHACDNLGFVPRSITLWTGYRVLNLTMRKASFDTFKWQAIMSNVYHRWITTKAAMRLGIPLGLNLKHEWWQWRCTGYYPRRRQWIQYMHQWQQDRLAYIWMWFKVGKTFPWVYTCTCTSQMMAMVCTATWLCCGFNTRSDCNRFAVFNETPCKLMCHDVLHWHASSNMHAAAVQIKLLVPCNHYTVHNQIILRTSAKALV